MDLQKDKFPKTVLGFYVRLYSKKLSRISGNKRNLIAEATKSWLNLNAKKKQAIIIKYNSRQLNLRKNFAAKLRKTVSFSKSSKTETSEKLVNIDDSSVNNIDTSQLDIHKDLVNNTLNARKNSSRNIDNLQSWADNYDEPDLSFEDANTSKNNNYLGIGASEPAHLNLPRQPELEHPALLLEPTPPQFRSNRDFYYLINKNAEHILKWEDITRGEKGQYERAAMQIRRNYLISYRSFLESLTPIELYKYYKNISEDKNSLSNK